MKRASFAIVMLMLMSGLLLAAAPAPRPTQVIARDSCVTSECHSTVKTFKVLHGPVNVNPCDACHKAVDPAKHTVALPRNKPETCAFCHQADTHNDPIIHY